MFYIDFISNEWSFLKVLWVKWMLYRQDFLKNVEDFINIVFSNPKNI
jgi:hypothetical protein